MAPFPVPTLAAQSLSAIYNPCRDAFRYVMRRRQDIKDLEDRIRTNINDVISVMSRNEEIERFLGTSVTTKKSKEYEVMQKDIEGIQKQCIKFLTKYAEITNNLPGEAELNVSKAVDMIDKLEDIKSKIWTLNFFKLSKLSRDIAKLSKRASGVLNRLEPKYMIHKISEPNQEKLHVDNELPVFDDYVNEVQSCLSEYGNRVGILGPVGVGKTTVLRRLHNRLINSMLSSGGNSSSRWDYVFWTEYPLELETNEKIVGKLQKEMMLQLKIDHERTDSIYENAVRISTFLGDRKYILLMDHVSYPVDLNDLGLRKEHSYGNVVIASSDSKAIRSMTEHEVEIKRLLKEHGRELLEKICGKIYDRRRRAIADEIIDSCGGITREIKFVANFLKNKRDESSWNDAKTILQSDTKNLNLIGLAGLDKIYTKVYEELEVGSKKCLLYGALFPHEHRIYGDYLIECWMAEGFLALNARQKLRRNRERGQTILSQLTDLYLLDWCSDKKYVKMPPNFRRVALELKYPDEEGCVIWMPSNDLEPDEETWTRVTRMSLIGCKTNLPESPECCNIYTLLLQFKPELKNLPDLFFSHMRNLKILDLNHTEIRALPSSINRLLNLRSLYVNGCNHLDKLPQEAGDLKKLEFLDICGTSLPSLPQVISSMVDLRCLRASFYPRRCNCNLDGKGANEPEVMIPKEIISNLKKLEELSIDADLHSDDRTDMAEELAKELASLKYLTTLCFNFPNLSSLNTFVANSESLKNVETGWGPRTFNSFKIFVGCHGLEHLHEYDVSEVFAERRLRCSTNEEFSPGCKEILKQASAFELIGNHHVEALSDFDLHSLQICVVARCNFLKKIVDGHTMNETESIVEESSRGALQNLEKLHLYDLPSLQCIWEGPVVSQSLVNLTVLTLKCCPKLTKILDPEFARTLPKLKHLKVEDCCEISEIVEVPEESNSEQVDLSNILKSLEFVELSDLPKLQSICKSTAINWNSMESIIIRRCGKLSNLSLTQTNAPKLASIKCEESWLTQLPDRVKQHFPDRVKHHFLKEDSSVLRVRPEGEASTSGRSDFDQASRNVDPDIAQGGEEMSDETKSSNGSPVHHIESNMNLDDGAKIAEEEMPNHDDLLASNIDSESDSSTPEDEIPKPP